MPHYGFNLQFLEEKWCWASCTCLFSCLCIFCTDVFVQNHCPFLSFFLLYLQFKSLIKYEFWKYGCLSCGFTFHSFKNVFAEQKILIKYTYIYIYFLLWIMLLLLYLNTYHQPQSQVDFLQWFLLEALWYCISYTYIICIRACHSFWGNFCEFLSSMCRCFVAF